MNVHDKNFVINLIQPSYYQKGNSIIGTNENTKGKPQPISKEKNPEHYHTGTPAEFRGILILEHRNPEPGTWNSGTLEQVKHVLLIFPEHLSVPLAGEVLAFHFGEFFPVQTLYQPDHQRKTVFAERPGR